MKVFKLVIAVAVVIASASALAADITVGSVLAYDRQARTLVLTDRTVWSLENAKSAIPDNLEAGDRVQISYESDEDGVSRVIEIRVSREVLGKGATDRLEGKVLAYDRKAGLLVMTDKTVWSLDSMKTSLPMGLDAGDVVQIQYQSDEDGVNVITSISILAD